MPVRRPNQQYDPNSGPPAPTDTTDNDHTIGVPEDYPIPGAVPKPGQSPIGNYGTTGMVFGGEKPTPTGRYMDGDEFIPANYDANTIYQLQVEMAKAGLLTSNFPHGVWDPSTMGAYRDLLAMANAQGVTAEQALAQAVSATNALGYETSPRAPLVIRQTDPGTLRQVFRKSMIDLTGVGVNQEQINNMVASYHQMESQRQQSAYDTEPEGGTVTDIPTPQDFAEDQIRTNNPEGVAGEEGLSYMNDFMRMAGGEGWG